MNELNIAKTLLKYRKEKGVTQEQLAEYIGVSKASVSKWECAQSYPDIVFLPQLAAYFNISIDELIDYKPQMDKKEIRRLYVQYSDEFAKRPAEEVFAELREIVKKYYACFPLLLQIGTLYINHYMLTKKEEQAAILEEALELFERVRQEGETVEVVRQAKCLEAGCYLILQKPAELVDLLENSSKLWYDESNLLASGYAMLGQIDKAEETLQVSIYQYILSMEQNLLALLQTNMGSRKKAESIIERLIQLADCFDLEKLHPASMLSTELLIASCYASWEAEEETMCALEKYVSLATGEIFPLKLKGDIFFDKLDDWLKDFDLPRNEHIIRQSIVDSVKNNPVFEKYVDNPRYRMAVSKLEQLCS